MPRFTIRAQAELSTVLAALGMPDAFAAEADFSGMTRQAKLAISAVVHEAFVAVDEAGTEAAAASAVVMREVSAPLDPVQLRLDRPFLFVIHEVATRTPLFVGRVGDPTR
jgi:serpin B